MSYERNQRDIYNVTHNNGLPTTCAGADAFLLKSLQDSQKASNRRAIKKAQEARKKTSEQQVGTFYPSTHSPSSRPSYTPSKSSSSGEGGVLTFLFFGFIVLGLINMAIQATKAYIAEHSLLEIGSDGLMVFAIGTLIWAAYRAINRSNYPKRGPLEKVLNFIFDKFLLITLAVVFIPLTGFMAYHNNGQHLMPFLGNVWDITYVVLVGVGALSLLFALFYTLRWLWEITVAVVKRIFDAFVTTYRFIIGVLQGIGAFLARTYDVLYIITVSIFRPKRAIHAFKARRKTATT